MYGDDVTDEDDYDDVEVDMTDLRGDFDNN